MLMPPVGAPGRREGSMHPPLQKRRRPSPPPNDARRVVGPVRWLVSIYLNALHFFSASNLLLVFVNAKYGYEGIDRQAMHIYL